MVALWNRADHYIFALWFLLLLLSSFFPRLISAVTDWMPYFRTWCGLSVNLGCSAARGSLKIQDAKKSPTIAIWHHRTTLSGYIFATKARIDNWKKNLLRNNTPSTCHHNMANFGPLMAEIG